MTEPSAEAPRPLLQHRPFRMLQLTRFSSRVAQNALNFALILLIVEETGKAFYSGLLVLALVIPATAAGIVAGTAADSFPKRPLIIFSDLVRAAICIWFVRADGGVAAYYFVAIMLATVTQFATNAEGATLPAIVRRDELARANAIGHAVGGIAQILGFGILTPLVLRLSSNNEDILFGIAAVLFFVAAFYAFAIGRIPRVGRQDVGGDDRGSWWLAGWREIQRDRHVRQAVIELTLISASLIIVGGLIPKYISDVLKLPVDIGVLILMPAAFGIILGLRIAGFLARRVPHALLSNVGFAGFVILLAMLAFVNYEADFLSGYSALRWLGEIEIGNFDGGAALAMILVFPLGFSYALAAVAAQTVMNDRVPLHLQGRVIATQGALAAIASSVPVLVAGALTDVVGVVPVMALLAGSVGLASVVNLRRQAGLAARSARASA
jgi:MFS family permease